MRVVQPSPTTHEPVADRDAIRAFFSAMVRSGDVHEVRIPKVRRGGPRRYFGVVSGYFDDADACADWLEDITGHDAQGVYLTLNPADPALLARAANRLETHGRLATTTDAQIVDRRHVVLDFDPVRPTDISATDAQRDQAMARADEAVQLLADLGWPPPVVRMMTGNGAALIYRVSLPNDDAARELVEGVLAGAVVLFGGRGVDVDTTVANASRVFKVAGTVAAKGDPMPDRPWRLATAELQPDTMPVGLVALETVAQIGRQTSGQTSPGNRASLPGNPASSPGNPASSGETIAERAPGLLVAAGVGYEVKERGGVTVYQLDRCLTSDDHTDGAAILALPSGAVAYRCHHNRCRDKGWADARAALGLDPTVAPGLGVTFTVGERTVPRVGAARIDATNIETLDASLAAGFGPAPAEAFYGWFGDYTRLMGPTTEAPDEFHLGSALALSAAMVGRHISTRHIGERLYPTLYVCLIGRSGSSRKDTAMKRATTLPSLIPDLLTMHQPGYMMIREVASSQGLIKQFQTQSNLFMYLSEMSILLKNTARESTSTIADTLMEAWDTPVVLENNTKKDAQSAVNPSLSIIAGIQPGRLATDMQERHLLSGFANRWLFIPGRGKAPMDDPPAPDNQAAWDLYVTFLDTVNRLKGRQLEMGPEARSLFRDWYHALKRAIDTLTEEQASMRERHHTNMVKLASLFAISDGMTRIELHHASAAIAFIEWMWTQIQPLLSEWGVTIEERVEASVLRLLTRAGAQGIKRRDLQIGARPKGCNAIVFGRVFDAMRANGDLVEDADKRVFLRELAPVASGGAR